MRYIHGLSPAAAGETLSPAVPGETLSPGARGETLSPGARGETLSPGARGETLSPAVPGGISAPALVIGGKGAGLVTLMGLGLSVPPGFVVSTMACREFLRDGRWPDGLGESLGDAMGELEAATGLVFGGVERPLLVSVRSGAAVSMPGMMATFLNVGGPTPAEAGRRLRQSVEAVFASWHTPRATTYRELHDIPHDLGTAVVVQAMVFGDRDGRSGSGVAFSRDPSTGVRVPYGDVLFGHQGDDVVSGRTATRPLGELAGREPSVWAALLDGLDRAERHFRDVCHVEFTFESGRLWFLQVRPGGLAGRAAVRVAVDLADEGIIDRATAVRRVTSRQLRAARTPRIRPGSDILARGVGASPGVATGRVALTADRAARMAAAGPVVLVRPQTSPLDMHGLAAAAGIVTTVGGPTSHAAVVARSMGKPAVVGAATLTADPASGCVHTPVGPLPEGTLITIDGTGGEVVNGPAETTTADADPQLNRLLTWAADMPVPP
ncbi:PEP/pyruvate-binding domain-containing protein [Actinoplanes subglobosus]|uniref:PEP/pyruvate-binding domain-containing protein n=1 Tax=Actinoplanes subglobosus TaxID=1547892 RepID=A0ABV8J8Q6_9ACTN